MMSQSNRSRPTLWAGLLLAGAVGAAVAQPASAPMGKTMVGATDRTFVDKAAMGGMAEVEAGKVAQQQGATDQVKQFGSRMVDDHTKANDELKQIAGSKGITPPAAPDKKAQADLAKMQKMSGAAFDRAYLNQMLADHKKTIALFSKEAQSGRDADLKAFATKTLPTLKEHLQMVQTTSAAVRSAKTKS